MPEEKKTEEQATQNPAEIVSTSINKLAHAFLTAQNPKKQTSAKEDIEATYCLLKQTFIDKTFQDWLNALNNQNYLSDIVFRHYRLDPEDPFSGFLETQATLNEYIIQNIVERLGTEIDSFIPNISACKEERKTHYESIVATRDIKSSLLKKDYFKHFEEIWREDNIKAKTAEIDRIKENLVEETVKRFNLDHTFCMRITQELDKEIQQEVLSALPPTTQVDTAEITAPKNIKDSAKSGPTLC